ncbi:hypothetical protein SP41_148 [Salmonella phage 41]|nr:hypothetical protein SP41_148 [Salmonella phage 41]
MGSKPTASTKQFVDSLSGKGPLCASGSVVRIHFNEPMPGKTFGKVEVHPDLKISSIVEKGENT